MKSHVITQATFIAIGFLVLIAILNWFIAGKSRRNIFGYIVGQDGRPSTSKFQFFVFTFAFVFAFVLLHIYVWFVTGFFQLIPSIPQNIMLAMGFSSVTFVGAKAITSSNIAAGNMVKTAPTSITWYSLVCDDNGVLDFSKFQMLIWTLIAVLVFIFDTYGVIDTIKGAADPKGFALNNLKEGAKMPIGLPDINPALMVLMGIGQGTYLGKKLIMAPTPAITAVVISTAAIRPAVNPGITIQGTNFGTTQGSSLILIDGLGLPTTATVSAWSPNAITFNPGPNHPNGTAFTAGQVIQISLLINGFSTTSGLPLTL